jgi:hypothetical protein
MVKLKTFIRLPLGGQHSKLKTAFASSVFSLADFRVKSVVNCSLCLRWPKVSAAFVLSSVKKNRVQNANPYVLGGITTY